MNSGRVWGILYEEVNPVRDLVGFKHGAIMHPYTTAMLANMRKQSLAAHKGPLMILNIVW